MKNIIEKFKTGILTTAELREVEKAKLSGKPMFRRFLLSNIPRLSEMYYSATEVDQQLYILRIIQKALRKEEMIKSGFFKALTEEFLLLSPESSKNAIREFISQYNALINAKNVRGCRVSRFKSEHKSIEFTDCLFFINTGHFSIYAAKEIVIISYESVKSLLMQKNKLTIAAHSQNTIEIEFYDSPEFINLRSICANITANELELEGSLSLSLTKKTNRSRVTFDSSKNISYPIRPGSNENEINSSYECISSPDTHISSDSEAIKSGESINSTKIGIDNESYLLSSLKSMSSHSQVNSNSNGSTYNSESRALSFSSYEKSLVSCDSYKSLEGKGSFSYESKGDSFSLAEKILVKVKNKKHKNSRNTKYKKLKNYKHQKFGKMKYFKEKRVFSDKIKTKIETFIALKDKENKKQYAEKKREIGKMKKGLENLYRNTVMVLKN
ncbi:hypothetical protein ENBRE01_1870 [Enteropsectra breve]|nr:hypothetical protein ENBRE01_1870 [Enteropsectra breve]